MNWKIIRVVISAYPQFFNTVVLVTERCLFVCENQSSPRWACKIQNTIFNLSLSRYDANLSRLVFRNLKESIKHKFTHFCESAFSAVSLTCLVNVFFFYKKEIYIFIVRDSNFFNYKIRVVVRNYEMQPEYNTNFYNLSYSLNALERGIYGRWRWQCVSAQTVSRRYDNASRYGTPPIVLSTRFHGYVGGYNIFHAMRQVLKLSREPRYTVFIATELIRR